MKNRLKTKLEKRASLLDLVITDIKGTPREVSRYLNKMTKLAKLKAKSNRITKTWEKGTYSLTGNSPRWKAPSNVCKRTVPKSDGGEIVNEDTHRLIVHVCPVQDCREPDPTAYFEHVMNFSEREANLIYEQGYTRVAQGTLDEMNEIKRDLEAFDISCTVRSMPKRS
jgi:hypothetical protein